MWWAVLFGAIAMAIPLVLAVIMPLRGTSDRRALTHIVGMARGCIEVIENDQFGRERHSWQITVIDPPVAQSLRLPRVARIKDYTLARRQGAGHRRAPRACAEHSNVGHS